MLPEYFEFTLPTRVVYGIGILASIREAVARFGKRRALLVTDGVLVTAGPVDRVREGFKGSGVTIAAVYDQVPPNSTLKTVEACAALGRKKRCDMVVAVGGGSVIDTAKTANLLMTKGGKLQDHMGAFLLAPDEALLPFVVIPTTAGTGSEVTRVAVIADPDNDVKLPFSENQFLPDLAVLDPEVTVSMPGKLTAATGMDALVHAIEAYVDKEWSPASDALALHAVRLLSKSILRACARPNDLEARGGMLVGSFLAGVAFSHSMVGMVHGISHALGGVYHIPHGLANALVLPEVMAHNLDACVPRYADIALALGVSFPRIVQDTRSVIRSGSLDLLSRAAKRTQLHTLRDLVDEPSRKIRDFAARKLERLSFVDDFIMRETALAGIERIRTLNRQLAFLTGMPLNLRDAGVDDDLARLDKTVATAMEDGSMLYNPVEPDPEAVARIIRAVYASREKPLAVTDQDLDESREHRPADREARGVFKDSGMLYDVLIPFYERLRDDPRIGPSLRDSGLCVQFRYTEPGAVITMDASGEEANIVAGDFDGEPEVVMAMKADFAHRFWLGKANLVTALTRRQVTARGNVSKTLKLLPILKPAFDLYPAYLRERGLEGLIPE